MNHRRGDDGLERARLAAGLISKPENPYARLSTATLRAGVLTLSRPGLRWLFKRALREMRDELLARELTMIADIDGGHVVAAIGGWQ